MLQNLEPQGIIKTRTIMLLEMPELHVWNHFKINLLISIPIPRNGHPPFEFKSNQGSEQQSRQSIQ